MHKIDSPNATAENEFTEGDAGSGILATEVSADWLNSVQRELIAILTAAGIAPNKATDGQILAAINLLINAHANLTNNPHSVTKSQVGLSDVPNVDFGGRLTQSEQSGSSTSITVGTGGATLIALNCGSVVAGDFAMVTGSARPAIPDGSRWQWLELIQSAGTATVSIPNQRNDYFAPDSAGGMTGSPRMRDAWPVRVTAAGTLTLQLVGYVSSGADRNFNSNLLDVWWVYKQ